MKKVIIEPGCISCGRCEFVCPAVFEVTDRSRVKKEAVLQESKELIKQAALQCPVQVIKYEE